MVIFEFAWRGDVSQNLSQIIDGCWVKLFAGTHAFKYALKHAWPSPGHTTRIAMKHTIKPFEQLQNG